MTMTFVRADGRRVAHTLKVAPTSRATFLPATIGGLDSIEFGTIVDSDEPVLVDSTIVSADDGRVVRSSRAVASPSTTWFMAGGATHSGLDLSYVILNPTSAAADVAVDYLLPQTRSSLSKSYRVPPLSRLKIWVNEEARTDPRLQELTDADVSAAITSSAPVVAEKVTSPARPGQPSGVGFGGPGVSSPSTTWFFAEGGTGALVDMYLTLANPNPAAATVDARYLLPSGEVIDRSYSVPGNSRSRIWVDLEDVRLADTAVAVTLRSINGIPVIAERSLFWPVRRRSPRMTPSRAPACRRRPASGASLKVRSAAVWKWRRTFSWPIPRGRPDRSA